VPAGSYLSQATHCLLRCCYRTDGCAAGQGAEEQEGEERKPALLAAQRIVEDILLDVFADAQLPAWLDQHLAPELQPTYDELHGFKHSTLPAPAASTVDQGGAAPLPEDATGDQEPALLDAVNSSGAGGGTAVTHENLLGNAAAESQVVQDGVASQDNVQRCRSSTAALDLQQQQLDSMSVGCGASAQAAVTNVNATALDESEADASAGHRAAELSAAEHEWLHESMSAPHVAAFSEFVLERVVLGIVQAAAEGALDEPEEEDGQRVQQHESYA
jgi:hypothetical protein